MSFIAVSKQIIESLVTQITDLQSQLMQKDSEKAEVEDHYRRHVQETEEKEIIQQNAMEELKKQHEEQLQEMENTLSALRQKHSEQLHQQRTHFMRMMETDKKRAHASASQRIQQVMKQADLRMHQMREAYERRLEEMQDVYEDLEAQVELSRCTEPVLEKFPRDCDAESVGSGDHAPEPTNDFATVPAEMLKQQFESMSSLIAKSMDTVNWQGEELRKQSVWLQNFLGEHYELVQKMRIESEMPEEVKKVMNVLKKEKDMEMDNLVCRLLDIQFAESLV